MICQTDSRYAFKVNREILLVLEIDDIYGSKIVNVKYMALVSRFWQTSDLQRHSVTNLWFHRRWSLQWRRDWVAVGIGSPMRVGSTEKKE